MQRPDAGIAVDGYRQGGTADLPRQRIAGDGQRGGSRAEASAGVGLKRAQLRGMLASLDQLERGAGEVEGGARKSDVLAAL